LRLVLFIVLILLTAAQALGLSVSDELGTNYTSGTVLGVDDTPNWGYVTGTGRGGCIVQQSWVVDSESYLGGWWNFNDMKGQCNLIGDGTHYGNGKVAHYWKADTFHPNQIARISHNPLQEQHYAHQNGGVTVRQSTSGDSAYLVTVLYVPLGGDGGAWGNVYGCGTNSYGLEAIPYFRVYRINSGTYTLLAEFTRPGWVYADDWWFLELQVWGTKTVNLRVVTRAPTSYVAGSTNYNSCRRLPAMNTYYLNYSPFNLYDSGYYVSSRPYGDGTYNGYSWISEWPDNFSPSTNEPVWYDQTDKDEPNKAWILWEGTDVSASKLTSGQPGFRYVDIQAQFSFAKFSADSIEGYIDPDGLSMSVQLGIPLIRGGGTRFYTTAGQEVYLYDSAGMAVTMYGLNGQQL
jgi:hypothetical protein